MPPTTSFFLWLYGAGRGISVRYCHLLFWGGYDTIEASAGVGFLRDREHKNKGSAVEIQKDSD